MTRHERPRNNSATSYHSMNSSRYGSEISMPIAAQGSRSPVQMPVRPRKYDREQNVSPGSFTPASPPPLSAPHPQAPIMNLSDHRRELSVLQTPPFILNRNPPSASNSPAIANGTSASAVTPTSFLNSNIFDSHGEFQLSPPLRPGTAPTASDSYFPADDRRPSVASVVTNASSTGSKSSIGRSFYKKIFGDGETATESPGSSESSLPPNATPRSHYGFPRPNTPTSSRPRTPQPPSSDVVPFLYQDPADIKRIGDCPVHDEPVDDRVRYEPDDGHPSSSSHRLLHRSRHKDKDKDKVEKELPPRPSTSTRDIVGGNDYRKGLRLHMDGTASNHSSVTRLPRPGSPTPSVASSLSNNPPRSPGNNNTSRKFWHKLPLVRKKDKGKDDEQEKEISPSTTRKAWSRSERTSDPLQISTSGIRPEPITPKRGSANTEFVNPRAFEYANVDQLPARKQVTGRVPETFGKTKAPKRGISCDGPDKKNYGNKQDPRVDDGTTFELDTDFSNIGNIVKFPGGASQATPPGPNQSWLMPEETPPLGNEITWEPPESWDSQVPKSNAKQGREDDLEGGKDTQYCIRVFRADSTFATLSCKLQSSVTEVLELLGRKSFLQDDLSNYQIIMKKNNVLRILGPNERPLRIQKRLLEQAGYTEDDHLEEIGREDHSYLCRFTFTMSSLAYSLDNDTGLGKVQKYSHVDLQGRNMLAIPIILYHKASEIISLNLSKNLSLVLPKDFIQQCVNLRKIEFYSNEAEKLPPSISAASRLTYLDISNNRLEELEHASLDNHSSLVALKIANNRLRSMPDSFNQFKSLRSLNIASNVLKSFPPFICELVTLVDLDISFNLIETFPLEIGQLSALERLTATNNHLFGTLPQTFSMLGSLKELDLRFNNLQNIDIVAELPRLELVLVGHNAVAGFQYSFLKVRALHLNSNPVTRFNIPAAMPTLKLLNLSNAKIAAIAESLFERLPNLEKLILDKNHIVSFPSQLGRLRKLEHLSCYNNELANLPKEIGQLQELRYLDLHNNNLKTLPGEIWQLINLVTLNVSSNIMREFPKPMSNPSTVQSTENPSPSATPVAETIDELGELDTSGGRRPSQASGGLLSVGSSPGGNGRNGSLVSIYGPGGRKASVISKSGSEPAVTISSRKDSAASSRISNTFAFSLRYLHLADNRLGDEIFEEICLLSELRVLNISYNDIYDIPQRALSRMSMLQELYLSGNEMTSLPAEDLEHISSLKVLHLNGNKFQSLPAELGKIRRLLVLDVGSNALKYNISNWPYDWNWNWNLDLKYLNLSGNKRLEIKPNRNDPNAGREKSITDFSQLSKLRVLGLMDVTITIPNVPDQTEDRRVRLSGSMVRSMAYGMADSLGRSEHLSMIDMVVPGFRGNRDECIIGLFDGQSSSSGGSKVSKYLHESLEFFLKEELSKRDEKPGKALHRAFLTLNRELAAIAMQTLDDKNVSGVPRGATTTSALLGPDDLNSGGSATVVYIAGNEMYLANVGDAMAVLIYSNSSHKVLTRKHDPGVPPELDRIREAGGYVSKNGKLNDSLDVSRSFGYFQHMPCVNAAPNIYETTITDQEELLIIASKDLWEYITFQAAVDVVRSERSDVMRAAAKLRDFAIAYGATGKLMVMVLRVGDLKKAKNRMRTQSVSLGPGNFGGDHGDFLVKVPKKKPKNAPDDSALARLDAEVQAPEGDLALVFTDIKNSTLLWETFPVAMRSGIKVHNNIMRRQLRIIGGYEIKTEGDAFIVCFPTPTSALLWCFSVQAILLDAPWPSEIVESEQGREIMDAEGNVIYRGLSVRMGIHWGAPVCEPDPITRRMDYFGPMVNRTSRISAEADGGQITVSSDFVAEINRCVKAYQESDDSSLSPDDIFSDELMALAITRELRMLSSLGFEVKELGERKLKGLENPEFIYLMYPQHLAGRLATQDGAPKPGVAKTSLDPDQVWSLWEIAQRLENLCSALSTGGTAVLKPHSQEMLLKMKNLGETSDIILLPLFEHIVTRIETCMFTLYMRRLLTPDPDASTLQTASPLMDLLATVESMIGKKICDGANSIPRIREIPELSPPSVTPDSVTLSPTIPSPTLAVQN